MVISTGCRLFSNSVGFKVLIWFTNNMKVMKRKKKEKKKKLFTHFFNGCTSHFLMDVLFTFIAFFVKFSSCLKQINDQISQLTQQFIANR